MSGIKTVFFKNNVNYQLVTVLCSRGETGRHYFERKPLRPLVLHHVGRFMFWALLGRINYIVGSWRTPRFIAMVVEINKQSEAGLVR